MNLSIKEVINKLLIAQTSTIHGADADKRQSITITSNTIFTAPCTGWLVCGGTTDSGQTLGPYMALQAVTDVGDVTYNMNASWGVTNAGAYVSVSGPIKKGCKYRVYTLRCSISGAYIFEGNDGPLPPPDATVMADDYVIEQGTDGIWTYRKWLNGTAECWGHQDVESTTYSANGGYKAISGVLPSGLFITTPDIVIASGRITGTINTDMGFTSPNNASTIQTYLINRGGGAVTQTGVVYWNVKGRWK